MATKPTKRILNWASGGTADDPGASKEASGWVVSERPPANWWNWILQSFGDWLGYFEDVTDEIVVRPQCIYAGFLELGSTPAVFWEKGDTVSFTDSGGNDIYLDFTTGVADPGDNAVHITTQTGNGANRIWRCGWNTNTRLIVSAWNDAGSQMDLNSLALGERIYITIHE